MVKPSLHQVQEKTAVEMSKLTILLHAYRALLKSLRLCDPRQAAFLFLSVSDKGYVREFVGDQRYSSFRVAVL